MRERTSTRRGAIERTSRCRTGGIAELERSTVEAEPENDPVERNADALEQADTLFDLGEVCVCLDDVPDEHVLGVPDSVEVVRHQVDPVCVGEEAEEVEVLEVPV